MSTAEHPTTTVLDEFVTLELRRRDLESQLKQVTTRQQDLQEPLAEWMAAGGIQNISKSGLTVYLKTQRWLRKTDEQALTRALLASDWAYLVKESINTNSLRSAVLEAMDNGVDLPEGVLANVEITENTVAAVRAS